MYEAGAMQRRLIDLQIFNSSCVILKTFCKIKQSWKLQICHIIQQIVSHFNGNYLQIKMVLLTFNKTYLYLGLERDATLLFIFILSFCLPILDSPIFCI